MTSWLHTGRKQKSEDAPKVRDYFLNLESGDFASYYVSLFNAHVFGNINGRSLNVYDKSNPISVSYSLLKEAFEPVSTVKYVSEMMTGVTILNGQNDPRYVGLLARLSKDELRETASKVLKWSPAVLEKVMETLIGRGLAAPGEPTNFDVGVHLRSRNRFDPIRAPTAAMYVSAIEEVGRKLKRKDLSVFVVAPDVADFIEFQRAAPTTWKLYQLEPAVGTIRGSNVNSFNRQNSAIKLNAYMEHVSELYCMQNCANIIGTLSSNIGRFLYLTATDPAAFRSLDTQTYI
jgi:hypothetical protein